MERELERDKITHSANARLPNIKAKERPLKKSGRPSFSPRRYDADDKSLAAGKFRSYLAKQRGSPGHEYGASFPHHGRRRVQYLLAV